MHQVWDLVTGGSTFRGQAGGSLWLPPRASEVAGQVDWLFYFILIVSLVFFVLIVVLMTLFVIRYHRPRGAEGTEGVEHNTALEITWSVVPLILVAAMFYLGFRTFMKIAVAPAGSYEILVNAQKWKWLFTYPNGYVSDELHVPLDEPVELMMFSQDVIHSFYVPAFRIKRDVVPGRYNKVWFRATQKGRFTIFCAEYCGTGHSDMTSSVVVHSRQEFAKWLEEASAALAKKPPAEAGADLYRTRGCASCHTTDGRPGIGPTFKGLFGSSQPLSDGTTVVADENYIRESIMDPQAKIVAGYQPVMPTFKGRLKDVEITDIIEFLKTLED